MATTRSYEVLAAPLGAVDRGRLVFTRGAAHLTISTDSSMDDLYRAHFEGKVPEVRVHGGEVTVRYRPTLHPKHGEITLSGRIPWSIDARFGMSDVAANLGDLDFGGWTISAGASRIRATLPRPGGTVELRIGAGASHVELIRPSGVPVSIHIGGGVSRLVIDNMSLTGTVDWRSPDYDLARDRYEIAIGAGASDVTVRT